MIRDDKFKDYFDSLINDFGEEEDEIYDSPQLDAKTGEFKTKEKEDNDIEILEEVVNVQRPKKELQLVKLVKIAPKPEVSVKKVKLDPSTGLFHDESGQEIQIVEKQKLCKEVVKIQPERLVPYVFKLTSNLLQNYSLDTIGTNK